MSGATPHPDAAATVRLRIGEVAELAGVSTRTVRYYEQLGLLAEVGRTPGGTRVYTKHDVDALLRIRELQTVLGFDLEQIRAVLAGERRMDELRAEWQRSGSRRHQREVLAEAVAINRQLRAEVEARMGALQRFLRDLEAKAERYREVARERGLDPVED